MIFSFEDIGPELPLVPLAARRALDAAGRKLALKAWQGLSVAVRSELATRGAFERVEVERVRELVAGASPAAGAIDPRGDEWLAALPADLAGALGAARPLSQEAWAKLPPLQRFALATAAQGRSGRLADAYDEIVPGPLSHIGPSGEARMVDVGEKQPTLRRAVAAATVRMRPETARLALGGGKKGDVLATARLAGIMAAKRTPDLVPLCHPIVLTKVTVELEVDVAGGAVRVKAAVEAIDRTGVEMEAMTAASVAALTVYDMLKAVERDMRIEEVVLLEKSGGRSGHFRREP